MSAAFRLLTVGDTNETEVMVIMYVPSNVPPMIMQVDGLIETQTFVSGRAYRWAIISEIDFAKPNSS